MAISNDKRLDDLERATGSNLPQKVIFARDDLPGEYTEKSPFGDDRGQIYNEAEKQALAAEFDLQIIEYTKNWRSYGEP